jgi:hypothetical protein
MAFCPLLGSVAFAALRKLFFREPLWLNVQDLPAEAGRATRINGSRIVHALGLALQRLLFSRAEVWSSISPQMVSQLASIKRSRTALHFCPNWLIGSLADKIEQLPNKIGRMPADCVKLLYSGTIGKKQALIQFCQALSESNLKFRFRICGDGSEAECLRTWARTTGDIRFQLSGLLPEDEFVRALHESDLFVITEMQGAGGSFLPSKLIPCISTATPVLAIADRDGPLGREVARHRLGLNIEWSELPTLPDRLAQLVNDCEQIAEFQANCLLRAKSYEAASGQAAANRAWNAIDGHRYSI